MEKERERNIGVQEKHQSVGSHVPPTQPETLTAPQACVLTRNGTSGLPVCRMCRTTPNQPSHTGQGWFSFQAFLSEN